MLVIALLLSAGAAAPAASESPLAKAEQGWLQCYRPDVSKKTCQSIASYRRTGPDGFDNKAIIPLGNGASLETHTPVTVKDGAVCGIITAQDVIGGTLRTGQTVVAAEQAKPVLERIAQGLAPLAGKEICTRYERTGADFTARVTIAGAERPDQSVTVKWISASDGYTVAP